MIRRLFDRKAGYEAQVLAEAQSLIDDGLELEFVLALFPDDAEWLSGMLTVVSDLEDAYAADQPSYYFEASLKTKFLGEARDPRPLVPVVISPPPYSPFRTAIATMSVATTAAALGILSLGFVTAGDSVPGDWNYTFKLANERFETTLSRGDSRVDVQFRQAEARVLEIKKLSERGDVSESQIAKLQREVDEIERLAKQKALDDYQKTRAQNLGNSSNAVLNEVANKQPELRPSVAAAATDIDEAVSAAVSGGPVAFASPEPSPPPATVIPDETATAAASGSPTASATPTPPPTETPTPTPTVTETPTATPSPTGTVTPDSSATATPDPADGDPVTPERPTTVP